MERAAFLLEASGDRIPCLLNPNTLVLRRTAGVQRRSSLGLPISGAELADDPLLFTGGGTTDLQLDLLFDVTIAGSTIQTEDVRVLTNPLWRMAENAPADSIYGRPPLVRFVWGKTWNIPGVIAEVAEKLEDFVQTGAPRRSWMRLRLLRVAEEAVEQPALEQPAGAPSVPSSAVPSASAAGQPVRAYEALGGSAPGGGRESSERLDEIAFRFYGHPAAWRRIAEHNRIDNPADLRPGTVIEIPQGPAEERRV